MQGNMIGPSWSHAVPGILFTIIWLGVMIVMLLAFIPGMRALVQIAATLQRIDARLAERPDGSRASAI